MEFTGRMEFAAVQTMSASADWKTIVTILYTKVKMLSNAALRKTGTGWEFVSEEAVEDFVEAHLESLLGLTLIKRQFTVNEQRCDIIAVDENKQLVVVELKNAEDRYIVQQLTRYYHALLEHKPFAEQVNYDFPVRLVAIAPSFHRDSFTDRKYNHLLLQFLQFAIVPDGDNLYFDLKDVDTGHTSQVEITHQQGEITENIPSPPKALLKLLSKCELIQQQEILKIRHKLLSFDKRMEEIVSAGSIKYGNGNSKNSKFCAELCSDSKGTIILFLWLPLKGLTSKIIGRARIWTDWNGNSLVEGYVSSGIGGKLSSQKKVIANQTEKLNQNLKNIEHQQLSVKYMWFQEQKFRVYINSIINIIDKYNASKLLTYEEMKYIELGKDIKNIFLQCNIAARYPNVEETIDNLNNSICKLSADQLIDLALEKWLKRL